jgi:hypothetical protein
VAPLRICHVPDPGHLAKKLGHWPVLLDLLGEGSLGSEALVGGHREGQNRRNSDVYGQGQACIEISTARKSASSR